MADLTPDDMASKLLVDNFSRSGPVAQAASDPLVDTPMVVTIDQLRPYEFNPRVARNANYDDIKTSIRQRGLDAPPPITRRPGATHYIIRNGGNTRLAVLNELWSETKDERFFRINCLFRPWPEKRGDIIALSGHLIESDGHCKLTFIERALGVEKMREFYEQDSGKSLTQAELARQLCTDGYPIQQSHISRMHDTVLYLLPCIPNVLYKGLGRHQVERLAVLRKAAELAWKNREAKVSSLPVDFEMLFQDVLLSFDTQPDDFVIERVQDELISQMAKLLGTRYNDLKLEISNTEQRQYTVSRPPQPELDATPPLPLTTSAPPAPTPTLSVETQHDPVEVSTSTSHSGAVLTSAPPPNPGTTTLREPEQAPESRQVPTAASNDDSTATRVQDHIVSPAASTDRLQAIQQLVAEHTGEVQPDFSDQALRAIPVQAGGLFPISDVWYIEPGLDTPERLRIHIAQFAREIAAEADLAGRIEAVDAGIGFTCAPAPENIHLLTVFGHCVLALLRSLSAQYAPDTFEGESISLNYTQGLLLLGNNGVDEPIPRLSDNGFVKLFRLMRLARRLLELEALPHETHS